MRHSADMHMVQGVGVVATNRRTRTVTNASVCLAFGGIFISGSHLPHHLSRMPSQANRPRFHRTPSHRMKVAQ